MSVPSSQEAQALLTRVTLLAEDGNFFNELETLVSRYERAAVQRAQREAFIQRLIQSSPDESRYLVRLQELVDTPNDALTVVEHWPPEELETLELHGLVKWRYGKSCVLEVTEYGCMVVALCKATQRQASGSGNDTFQP